MIAGFASNRSCCLCFHISSIWWSCLKAREAAPKGGRKFNLFSFLSFKVNSKAFLSYSSELISVEFGATSHLGLLIFCKKCATYSRLRERNSCQALARVFIFRKVYGCIIFLLDVWMHPPQPWCACLIKGCAITYLMHINRITKHARSIQEYSNAITIDLLPSFDIQKCGNHREKTIFTNTLNASFNFFFHNLLRLNSRWSGRIYGGGNTKWRNYECTQFTLEARIRRSTINWIDF